MKFTQWMLILLLKNLVCFLVFEQELTTYSYSRTIITVPDLHFIELFHISKNIMTNSCFPKLMYALVLLLLRASGSILGFNWLSNGVEIKCIEMERQALLKFKQGILVEPGILSTWSDDDRNSDCWKWKGIQYNNEKGHVRIHDLRGQNTQYLKDANNISSLVALQNIKHLEHSFWTWKAFTFTVFRSRWQSSLWRNPSPTWKAYTFTISWSQE